MHLLKDKDSQMVDLIVKENKASGIVSTVEGIFKRWLREGAEPTPTYQHLIACLKEAGMGAFAARMQAMAGKEKGMGTAANVTIIDMTRCRLIYAVIISIGS